jgi:hypothetical protein
MNFEIRAALNELLIETAHWKSLNTELVCFCPMQGSAADGRLMLVGRALRGWGTTPFKASQMESESERDKILENTLAISSADQGCPIQRSHDFWRAGLRNKTSKYNPERSSFWCVARDVVKAFSTPGEAEKWANHLYWTNLYKISLANRSNPPGSLKKVTEPASLKMLATEIEFLRPQRILFLTGPWWAEPFLHDSNYVSQKTAPHAHVYQTGVWSLTNGKKAAVLVADHPERKKRSVILSGIMQTFSELGYGSRYPC